MNIGIKLLFDNIGLGFENGILIILMLAGIILYAKDFKIGLILQMLASGVLFIIFYQTGYNYTPSLIVFLMSFVILALTLIMVHKSTERGALV